MKPWASSFATLLELFALSVLTGLVDGPRMIVLALLAHALAVVLVMLAAGPARREHPAEFDLAVLLACFVPLVGPLLFANLLRGVGEAADGVAGERQVLSLIEGMTDPLGEPFDELAVWLDVRSQREVLDSSDRRSKQELIGRLVENASPNELSRVRSLLDDRDDEVRLFAYGHLDELAREHEDRIAGQEDVHARAEAHLAYATSGLCDTAYSRYHLERALELSQEAWNVDQSEAALARVILEARLGLGHWKRARRFASRLPDDLVDERMAALFARLGVGRGARENVA